MKPLGEFIEELVHAEEKKAGLAIFERRKREGGEYGDLFQVLHGLLLAAAFWALLGATSDPSGTFSEIYISSYRT